MHSLNIDSIKHLLLRAVLSEALITYSKVNYTQHTRYVRIKHAASKTAINAAFVLPLLFTGDKTLDIWCRRSWAGSNLRTV